jgi:hypothetical protein
VLFLGAASQRALAPVSERLTLLARLRLNLEERVVTDLSGIERGTLFEQHLKLLREERDAVLAHVTASPEMIERSRALIEQIDEQINRMESELGWFGGLPRPGWPFRPSGQRQAKAVQRRPPD